MRRLLLLILFFDWVCPINAAFDDSQVGGRPPGMAGAFSAVADNGDAAAYNPAGASQLKDPEISTEYGQVTNGASDGSSNTDTYVAYVHPMRDLSLRAFSLSYHLFKASNLFSERTLTLGYSRLLPWQPFDLNGLWLVGANLKQLYREYQPDRFTENALNDVGTATGQPDPLFAQNGYNKTAYAFDLGTLFKFGPANRHSASFVITNANRPDISLGSDGEKAPMTTKIGLATRPNWGLVSLEVRRTKRLASQDDTDVAVGAERVFHLSQSESNFVIRGGYAQGSRSYKDLTTGVSYQFPRASLDYAFEFPVGNLSGTQGTHHLGLSFKLVGFAASEQKKETPEKVSPSSKQPLPSAPQTLTAPVPVSEPTKGVSAVDATAKNYGVMLGQYFTRKDEGASLNERKGLLLQMKGLFQDKGMDMTLIQRELDGIAQEEAAQRTPEPTPTPAPAVTPEPRSLAPLPTPEVKPTPISTPKPVETPIAKKLEKKKAAVPVPTPTKKVVRGISAAKFNALSPIGKVVVSSSDLDEAMRYYRKAVQRGLSDHERIEILESLLLKFGEEGAKVVTPELERIKKRSE